MNSQNSKRQKLYINPAVQGQLIVRLAVQWCFYLAAILLVVSLWAAIRHPDELAVTMVYRSFVYFAPAILASIILLPLFAFDYLRQTNKIVGPIHRLNNEMKKLVDDEDVSELRFRDGDHWNELAADFNKLAKVTMRNRRAFEDQNGYDDTLIVDVEPQPVA